MDFFINIIKTIVLGIIEGVTEWLPVSSTGHMILVEDILKLKVTPEFWNMFMVVIQLGAILAVMVIFWHKLWPFHTKKLARNHFSYISDNKALAALQRFTDNHVYLDKIILWLKILVSCLPAIIIGLPLNDWLEEHTSTSPVVAAMLVLYGILFIVIENYNKRRKPKINKLSEITFQTALFIGIFQVLSLIPGTSRSGATIIGGILVGASRKIAAEYTFFLAIPVMCGASLLRLVKFGFNFTGEELVILLVGMLVAFFVSLLAIKFLMNFVKKHDFKVFGWYRIVLGLIVIGVYAAQNFIK
ncbi:MAG: undecaprenyl-diphosphate phosphatase [Clostridiales bacterium]|nr:undecaprenyl-diphosphate phosphatase [Clostridiales bacterium]